MRGKGDSRWIWRCHIDTSQPNPAVWAFIRRYLEPFDAAVFTMEQFVPPDFPVERVDIIPPAIDPLSPKNMPLDDDMARALLEWIGVEPDRPLVSQVSRFDPWKDPLGVIEAFRLARHDVPNLQLALVGSMALDDPEGWEVYRQVRAESLHDPAIHIFTNLTGVGNIEVNAFQRLSQVAIQKSIREGFGLVVSEALWKGTPVVAGNAGGIPLQMADGVGGRLVDTVEECAAALVALLAESRRREGAGTQGPRARARALPVATPPPERARVAARAGARPSRRTGRAARSRVRDGRRRVGHGAGRDLRRRDLSILLRGVPAAVRAQSGSLPRRRAHGRNPLSESVRAQCPRPSAWPRQAGRARRVVDPPRPPHDEHARRHGHRRCRVGRPGRGRLERSGGRLADMAGRRSDLTALGLAIVLLVAGALTRGVGAQPSSIAGWSAPVTASQLHLQDPTGALASGRVLVAARTVGDPTFAQTVVLLFAYSSDGAAGLIVNRRTSVPVQRLLPNLPVPEGPAPRVFLGGPVSVAGIRALLRSPAGTVDGRRILTDVSLLGTPEALKAAMAGGVTAERLRLYVGYTGWGPGQLEREVRRGDWFVFDGDSAVVFDPEPDTLWRREVRLTEMRAV